MDNENTQDKLLDNKSVANEEEKIDPGHEKTRNKLRKAGIICMIASLPLMCIPFVGFPLMFAGLVMTMMGYAGKVSLAQAAFMGIGAYVSVLLVKEAGVNFWLAMVIATLVCTLIGAGIGFPALRVQGHYLAFVTLGFNELVVLVIRNEDQWTGGPMGILNIARPSIFGYSLFDSTRFYYFCPLFQTLMP